LGVTLPRIVGQVLYGAAFCVVLPILLWTWARHAAVELEWPLPMAPLAGVLLAALGGGLMLAAMATLARDGGGLPMNLYPPPRYCATGPYRWFAHPIYVGFGLLCLGVSFVFSSPAGVYLVTPVVAAGAFALVVGYERPALLRRHPGAAQHVTLLTLPRGDSPLTVRDRLAVGFGVLVPWLALFLWAVELGPPRDAVAPWLPGEQTWPVLAWTYPFYASTYLFVALAPFWARDARALAEFARAGRAATVLHLYLYLVVPITVEPREFTPLGPLGRLLAFEGEHAATGAAAFPSFHVTWAVLTALLAARSWPRYRGAAWMVAATISISCSTTGMHAVADIVAGVGTAWIVIARWRLWELLRRGAERLANSLRAWRFGAIRVFVHAPYAGLAGALVVAVVGRLAGTGALGAVLAVAVSALVGAALWGQWVEGGIVSLRPFGYYGSVVGALACLGVLALAGVNVWPLLGGLGVAAPFAQAIGRLRCVTQGCCHGRPAPPHIGIVCTAPLSRVARVAGLSGVPLHPTALGSLLWNLVCGVAWWRCAALGQPPSVVAGLYLLGNGLGRFIEEAYRGEPQTRRSYGLSEYQWYAAACVALGAALTCVPSAWPLHASWSPALIGSALCFGVLTAFAMGVDWPGSSRRFARLGD
jgi:protein-S-isoprenylcysteine O-methyltransferase Ste14